MEMFSHLQINFILTQKKLYCRTKNETEFQLSEPMKRFLTGIKFLMNEFHGNVAFLHIFK